MTQTKAGGLKVAKTNKKRHGEDYYSRIGRLGGAKSRGGGFAANPALARIAGRKGGLKSKRGPGSATREKIEPRIDDIAYWVKEGKPIRWIAEELGVGRSTLNKWLEKNKESLGEYGG